MNPCKMPDVVRSGMQDTCMMNGMQVATCTAINIGRIIRRSLTRRKPIEPRSRDGRASVTVERGMCESRPIKCVWTHLDAGRSGQRTVALMGCGSGEAEQNLSIRGRRAERRGIDLMDACLVIVGTRPKWASVI